jgi:hypothetical protein
MQIEKNIAFLVNQQFPAIYRENGSELISLVEEYYNFLETETNQSTYINRRLFEYKDITTTISSMIIFFQKKYMADLPLKEENVRFIARNIMDLYRRKGTQAGIKLFFRAFYQEDVEIFYPASKMFKPSDSQWKTGIYLQMFPNNDNFKSINGKEYTYNDLLGRNIRGSSSKAVAVVNKINSVMLNGTNTPIIYIEDVRGTFQRFDEILTTINDEVINFGSMNGSLSNFLISDDFAGTTGNQVGDVFNVESTFGTGGKAIVTEVTEEFTGEIIYTVDNGGFGYSIENTRLIVSDQVIITDNRDLQLIVGERVQDSDGNTGIVVGQNENAIGVKMDTGSTFVAVRPISTVNRSNNITIIATSITAKNGTSPGPMFADTSNNLDVKIGSLSNTSNTSIIIDPIQPYLNVVISATDYGTMSGNTSPVNLSTSLDQAFQLAEFTIGTIESFINVDPGVNYVNDVFAFAIDDVFSNLEKYNQIISLTVPASAGSFTIGEIIEEANTGVTGIVRSTNISDGIITVTPYDFAGFSGERQVIKENGAVIEINRVDVDYSSAVMGNNANINSRTEFSVGRITKVAINDTGFGYVDTSDAFLVNNDGNIVSKGILEAETQGKTSGYWSSVTSHLNGYVFENNNLNYYDSSMKIQDSDFYQEYSYQIKSRMGIEQYEQLLRENAHLAGTKLFGVFSYSNAIKRDKNQRFTRVFNDNGAQSPLLNE